MSGPAVPGGAEAGSTMSAISTRALTGTVVQDVWDLIPDDPRQLGDVRIVKRLKSDTRPIHDQKMTPFLGEQDGRWVVLKAVLRGALASQLAAEAAAASRWGLSVPNPVGNDDRYAWAVRQFVDGRTLSGLRARPDFAENRGTLALLLLQRISEVHAAGGHHGDIKPSNVLVTPDLSVQLIDFESASGGQAQAAIRHLTPEFAAPEHFDLDAEVGQPADVFSWGLTVADLYAPGQHPFLPGGFSGERLIQAYRSADRTPALDPGMPRQLKVAVVAALRLPPSARPTASALLRTLDRDRPSEAPPTLTMQPGLVAPATADRVPTVAAASPTRVDQVPPDRAPELVRGPEPDLPGQWWVVVFGASGYPGRRQLSWQLWVAYGLLGIVLAFLTALVLFVVASSIGVWLQP